MKNFDEDNDGRLNYREFKQVNLGSKMRSSLSTCPVQAILPPAPESETEPKGEDKAEENAS